MVTNSSPIIGTNQSISVFNLYEYYED